jgi:thiol-disulfide isomerase/thioredoxin
VSTVSIRELLVGVAVWLVAGGMGVGITVAKQPEVEPVPAEYTFTTLDGEELSFGELRGKVVVLDFWFTGCSPCRQALPNLRRMAAKYEGRPFVMIGISVDKDLEVLRQFILKEELSWPQVWDPRHAMSGSFGIRSFPTHLVIDHEGLPVSISTGWSPRHEMKLTGAVMTQMRKLKKAEKQAWRSR